MTIGRKWLLTVGAFVVAGLFLEILISVQIILHGARSGTYEWLSRRHETGIAHLNGWIWDSLEHHADALLEVEEIAASLRDGGTDAAGAALRAHWHGHSGGDFWLIQSASGDVLSSMGECTQSTVAPRPEGRGYGFCGSVPVIFAAATQEGSGSSSHRLFIGRRLGAWYVDDIEALSDTHAILLGSSGIIASTMRDRKGERVSPELDESTLDAIWRSDDSWFGKPSIGVSLSYGGYRDETELTAAGLTELDAYVFAAPLEVDGGEIPLRILLMIPAAVMDQRATYVGQAMTLVGAVIVLLLILVAWRLVSSFTRPLSELSAVTERVAEGDFSARIAVRGDDEVASLGRSFNTMVERLAESRARVVQAEKMAAIGQVAGGVAHEINNPLGVILGFAQGMETRMRENDPMRRPVGSIVREALRCKSIVQELLTFARTAKNTDEVVDVSELVAASTVLLESRAKTQGIRIVQDLDERLPPFRANRTQLQQVLINLGTNALDATSGGGTVTLRTRRGEEGVACLQVLDTGSGIPEAVRGRIFEPFFTTKEPGKGTGLGLGLVYEIVQQHGGSVDVESEEGKGTTMSVRLPIRAPVEGGADE